jgi:prepilin-type N-terminal cleavage/methylation domain-containing protein
MKMNRGGFTIVESLVALGLLGVVALGLMYLSANASSKGNVSSAEAYRTTFLTAEFARAMAIPVAASVAGTTCDSTFSAPFVFSRCTRITNLTERTQQVAVTISPVNTTLVGADSMVVIRAANIGALDLSGGP